MIYFDHSATTPTDEKVLEKMLPYFNEKFGNSSSLHSFGQIGTMAVDQARIDIANFLNCETDEIIFTSGATESNNLAIKGLVKALKIRGLKSFHIITSAIEHDAILEPLKELEKDEVEVTYIKPDKNGVVNEQEVLKNIKENTVLVSIMYANSEVGSIQPIREIGKIIKKINEDKLKDWEKKGKDERGDKPYPIYFHTDATQAVNFLNCDTKYLHVDLLSLSGHKIYGPKGVGLLFVKNKTPLSAIQKGGHQEKNLRSGTLNVPGIVGLAEAVKLVKENQEENNKKISEIRNYLIKRVEEDIDNVILNTNVEYSVPGHAHFSFLGVEGEAILIALDLEGFAVSTGSACASGSLEASHVLLAMGIKQEESHNAVRFTLGKNNKKEDIDNLLKVLPKIVKRFRDMAPDL